MSAAIVAVEFCVGHPDQALFREFFALAVELGGKAAHDSGEKAPTVSVGTQTLLVFVDRPKTLRRGMQKIVHIGRHL